MFSWRAKIKFLLPQLRQRKGIWNDISILQLVWSTNQHWPQTAGSSCALISLSLMRLSYWSKLQPCLYSETGKYLNFRPGYLSSTQVSLPVWSESTLNPEPRPSRTHRVTACELTERAQADDGDRGYAPDVKSGLALSSFLSFKRPEVPL